MHGAQRGTNLRIGESAQPSRAAGLTGVSAQHLNEQHIGEALITMREPASAAADSAASNSSVA